MRFLKESYYRYFAVSNYDSEYYTSKEKLMNDLKNFGDDVEVKVYSLKSEKDIQNLTSEDLMFIWKNGKIIEKGSSYKKSIIKEAKEETIELEYKDLPIEIQSDYSTDYYRGPQWSSKNIHVDYTHEVPKNYILDAIVDEVADEMYDKYPDKNEFSDVEIKKYFEDNFDTLFDKYKDTILDYFKEDAIEKAEIEYSKN